MNYKVVKVQETDNFDICELYEKVFGKPMCEFNSSEIFSWFYFQNLYKRNYSRGLHNGQAFLSFWGFIPIGCKINDKILKGSLSFQLISSPEILGASLLLWKEIRDVIINDDVFLNFTINNDNSYLLLKKMGWEMVNTPILIKILHPFKLINDSIRKKNSNKFIIKILEKIFPPLDYVFSKFISLFHHKSANVIAVNCFNENYDDLLGIMNNSIIYGVNLDYKYMNWRYIEKPNNTYKILSYVDGDKVMGYLIYDTKKDYGTNIGYIMDIIADPDNKNIINSLIRCAIKEMFQKGVTLTSALSFKENIFYKNYKDTGFFNAPKTFLPHQSYFSINNLLELEIDIEVNKWHISWGNHDNL